MLKKIITIDTTRSLFIISFLCDHYVHQTFYFCLSVSSVLPHSIITGRFSWRFLCSTIKNRNVKNMKFRFVPKIILKFLNMYLELFPFVNPFLPLTNQEPVQELCTLLLAEKEKKKGDNQQQK